MGRGREGINCRSLMTMRKNESERQSVGEGKGSLLKWTGSNS